MSPEAQDIVILAATCALYTCVVLTVALLVLTKQAEIWAALGRGWAWARRTFTKAGDGFAPACCPQCGQPLSSSTPLMDAFDRSAAQHRLLIFQSLAEREQKRVM